VRRAAETDADLEGVAFGDDRFVVVGSHAAIRNSHDGIEWF
jgi:hypothetical protein